MKSLQIMIVVLTMTFGTLFAQAQENLFFSKTLQGSFEEVTQTVKSALKEQGFGVVTEIDMDVTLKEKLPEADLMPYKILGVCNPSYAYKTIQLEENIGLFLPCKAIVKDIGNGEIEVAIVNPVALMDMLDNPELVSVAKGVSEKFKTALSNM